MITENSFTGAELAAAVQANPALAAELKTFGETAGFHVRTKDEETTFLQNYETTVAGRKTSEIANAIEKDIKEAYGVDKNENEKYHDYLKRVAGEHKTKLGALQTELADLKKGGKPDSDDKIRITQLEQAITAEKEKLGNEIKEKDKTIHNLKSGFEIEKALGSIRSKYKLGIPDDVVKTFEKNVSAQLIADMKEIDGVFVVIGKDGAPEMDLTTYKPKTVEQAMKERMASMIDEGRKQGGAGTGKEGEDANQTIEGVTKDAKGDITEIASIPAEIKTKVALTEWLMKIGLPTAHPVHIAAYEKFGKDLVLR